VARKKPNFTDSIVVPFVMILMVSFIIGLPLMAGMWIVDKSFGTHWVTRDASCDLPPMNELLEVSPSELDDALRDHYSDESGWGLDPGYDDIDSVFAWPSRAKLNMGKGPDQWWRQSHSTWIFDEKCSRAEYDDSVIEPKAPWQ